MGNDVVAHNYARAEHGPRKVPGHMELRSKMAMFYKESVNIDERTVAIVPDAEVIQRGSQKVRPNVVTIRVGRVVQKPTYLQDY